VKIAFVSQPWNTCPSDTTSIAHWTYEVAQRLVDRHAVIVYSKMSSRHPAKEYLSGISFRRYSIWLDDHINKRLSRASNIGESTPRFGQSGFYLPYAIRVALDLRRQSCDIVHVHNLSQFVPLIKRLNPRTRVVLHMHCEWLVQLPYRPVARRLAHANRVIGVSDHITSAIRARFPEIAGICRTVSNGVALIDQMPPEKTPPHRPGTVLFVGRVSPEKGIHDLVDAFSLAAARMPDIQLMIVGPSARAPKEYIVDRTDDPRVRALARYYEGDYLDALRRRVPDSIREKVTFTGLVAHGDLDTFYARADILANPSLSEAFGMTLIEAMAHGMPVIATRAGGMVEIVRDGETGLLVEPGDIKGLADAIVRLLSDVQLCRRLGKGGKATVAKHYAWEVVTRSLLAAYGEESIETGTSEG